MKNKAFTLIELLVVVLIIGILAAIAVPQYQKAVKKSQGVEAILNLKSLKRAQEAYYLANGKYTTNLANLDLTFNNGIYYYYCTREVIVNCYAQRVDGNYPFFEQVDNELYCRGTQKDCEPFSNTQIPSSYYPPSWLIKE